MSKELWNLISGKSKITENFPFPISCTRPRYEKQNTLIGNGKSEILETLEPWNSGIL